MKVFSIFIKNLKTVSRNWGYFLVLFICPIVLIGLAGMMLNSTDFRNSRIGISDEEIGLDSSSLNSVSNIIYFSSLDSCLSSLEKGKIVACIDSKKVKDGISVKVHLDNSRKAVIYYVKQSVLQNLFEGQSNALEKNTEETQLLVKIYIEYIKNAKIELGKTYSDLSEQESLLIEYRKNLTTLRQNFNNLYYNIKSIEPEITRLRSDLARESSSLQADISRFRNEKNNIISNVNYLRSFLSSRLSARDYEIVSSQLNAIVQSLNRIDSTFSTLERAYSDSSLIKALDSLPGIIKELDSIKIALDSVDRDLGNAILKVQSGKQRILQYSNYLDNAEKEIIGLSKSADFGRINVEFIENNELANRPVLLAFPLLITIIITFTSIVLSNMFILRQVNHPSYLRSIITPTKDSSFLAADYLINIFFISVQIIVLAVIGVSVLGLPPGSLLLMAVSTFLAASIFIFAGMSLGYLIKSQSVSMLISVFLVMMLIILSDFFVPSILVGQFMKFFIDLNPFVILNKSLEYSILLGKDFYYVSNLLFAMGFFSLVMLFVAYASKKISRLKAIE